MSNYSTITVFENPIAYFGSDFARVAADFAITEMRRENCMKMSEGLDGPEEEDARDDLVGRALGDFPLCRCRG